MGAERLKEVLCGLEDCCWFIHIVDDTVDEKGGLTCMGEDDSGDGS